VGVGKFNPAWSSWSEEELNVEQKARMAIVSRTFLVFVCVVTVSSVRAGGAPKLLEGEYVREVVLPQGAYEVKGLVICRGGLILAPGTELSLLGQKALLSVRTKFLAGSIRGNPVKVTGSGGPALEVTEGASVVECRSVEMEDISFTVEDAGQIGMTRVRMKRVNLRVANHARPSRASFTECWFEDMSGFNISRSGNFLSAEVLIDNCSVSAPKGVAIMAGGTLGIRRSVFVAPQVQFKLEAAGRLKGSSIVNKGLITRFWLQDSEVESASVSVEVNKAWIDNLEFFCARNNFPALDTFDVRWEQPLRVQNNYWGTASAEEVSAKIGSPRVLYKPFAVKPFAIRKQETTTEGEGGYQE
jgi:hypothetical protein